MITVITLLSGEFRSIRTTNRPAELVSLALLTLLGHLCYPANPNNPNYPNSPDSPDSPHTHAQYVTELHIPEAVAIYIYCLNTYLYLVCLWRCTRCKVTNSPDSPDIADIPDNPHNPDNPDSSNHAYTCFV